MFLPRPGAVITSAALFVGLALLGGGTLELAGQDTEPVVTEPAPAPLESSPAPTGESPPDPLTGLLGLAAVAAALAALQRSKDDLNPGSGLSLDTGPVVVFVPGHGQAHGSAAFADLIEHMEIDEGSVRHFDYRWVGGGSSAALASEHVAIDSAVSSLNSFLAGVAGDGREIYLVGFSKGGATVAELVADWDDGRWGPSEAVVGAALLDPPIARGPHGRLQSIGRLWGSLPDDGGYDPIHCTFLGFGCSDRRVDLGSRAGVEVVVVRNPKAAVTSFGDHPAGLRVYDAADDGPTIWGQLARNPFALPRRIAEAHDAVLHDPKVADCIVAELRSGTCDLPSANPVPRLPGITRGVGRAPAPQKVL